MKPFIYAYGMICPSRLIVLNSDFPSVGEYAEIASTHDSFGGEAANSSIVLAKLGVKVRLDGNWLRADDSTAKSLKKLSELGIDTALIKTKKFEGPEEVVIS